MTAEEGAMRDVEAIRPSILRRNTLWAPDKKFAGVKGAWTVVPTEDFLTARAAYDALVAERDRLLKKVEELERGR